MAKVRLNPVMEQIRGHVGEVVFKRHGDKIILTRKAHPERRPPSTAQIAHRARFQQAVAYGRSALADPLAKAFYQALAKERNIPIYSGLVADYFHAPSVGELDLGNYGGAAGDSILFRAEDDTGVVSARVSIARADGTVLESGSASETAPGSGLWRYTTTQSVPNGVQVRITATATDRPGGAGSRQAEIDF